MIEFLTDSDNLTWLIPLGVVIFESLLDRIPDKYLPYVGVLRRVLLAYLGRKKVKESQSKLEN